ncbi:MAG: RDD family protein [Promethearchaeota archaeon]
MYCPACGEKIPGGTENCPTCGARISDFIGGAASAVAKGVSKRKGSSTEKGPSKASAGGGAVPAGFLSRLVAYIIDAILLSILTYLITANVPYFSPLTPPRPDPSSGQNWWELWGEWRRNIPLAVTVVKNVVDFLVYFAYFAGMEAATRGQTLGKVILGIRTARYSEKKDKTKDLKPGQAVANGFVKANFFLLLLDCIVGYFTRKGAYERFDQFRFVPQKTKSVVVKNKK